DIVEKIYKVSAGPDGKYQSASAFSDNGIRKRYFSKALLAQILRMEKKSARDNEPILDFDPITNSQDPDVKDLTITVESRAPAKPVVAAKFFSFDDKQPSIVRYDFVLENATWRIDEIRGEHGTDKWSLRDIIK